MINERDIKVIEIIKTIINDFGVDVFGEKRRASAIVADYFSNNNLSEEKTLLNRVLASCAMSFISANKSDYAADRKRALYTLTEHEFIAEVWAERVLMWFDMALGHNIQQPDGKLDFLQQLINASQEAEKEKQKTSHCELVSPIDALLDEYNTDNIVLYNDNNEKVEFEQIALIPLGEKSYAILKPVLNLPGISDDEALVFVIDEVDDEDGLVIVEDDSVVNDVFEEYYKMLCAEGIDVN